MKRNSIEGSSEVSPRKKPKVEVTHNHKIHVEKQSSKKKKTINAEIVSNSNKNVQENVSSEKFSKEKKKKNKSLNLSSSTKKANENETKSNIRIVGKGTGKIKTFKKSLKEKFEKPADWNEFKKMKKELQVKRKQNNSLYEISVQAKKISENLRRKTLKGGEQERKQLTADLHELLGKKGNYPKFVLQHDMARIVQYLLKFGSETIRKDIAEELIPQTVNMLQSKYGKFCIKRMLKYGNSQTRSSVIKACYGNVVKLASHVLSAAVLDYGYTTWATAQEKYHFVQEFYGDMYKNSKDDKIKHVRDTYATSLDMKDAILGAMKANLARILNKELLDSHLVQTAILQYLEECSPNDRTEIISQLAPHVVVLSNSKEGANAAMLCFWHGNNKDKKVSMKALKEHVIELSKHPDGHKTIIAILDSVDDTVLLNKMLLSEIILHGTELATDDLGRRILLWLTGPANPAYFHPTFINELVENRQKSGAKKDQETRRKEILEFVKGPLLDTIIKDTKIWLSNCKSAVVLYAVLVAGSGPKLDEAFENVSQIITDPDWKIKEKKGDQETEEPGIENSGLHMVLKKLIINDKASQNLNKPLFTTTLLKYVDDDLIKRWIPCNRTCFLLVNMIENSSDEVQKKIRTLLKPHCKTLQKYTNTAGADILLNKIKK